MTAAFRQYDILSSRRENEVCERASEYMQFVGLLSNLPKQSQTWHEIGVRDNLERVPRGLPAR
jgi:hypothetical protein